MSTGLQPYASSPLQNALPLLVILENSSIIELKQLKWNSAILLLQALDNDIAIETRYEDIGERHKKQFF